MQGRTFQIIIFLCIAAIGCYATISQVIRIREFLNIFYGNEPYLGIVFGAWFLGSAIGTFVGAKIEHTFKHAFSVFIITLFVMCLVLPVDVAIVFQKIEGYKLHIQSDGILIIIRSYGRI